MSLGYARAPPIHATEMIHVIPNAIATLLPTTFFSLILESQLVFCCRADIRFLSGSFQGLAVDPEISDARARAPCDNASLSHKMLNETIKQV